MISLPKYRTLGNLINTTWGASSVTGRKPGTKMYKLPQYTIKMDFVDDKTFRVKYSDMITYSDDSYLKHQLGLQDDKSSKIVNKILIDLKKKFKKESGDTIKFKQRTSEQSFEMVNVSPHSPKRVGQFRKIIYFDFE